MGKEKERSDKYYLEKFNLTEEQLADYKRKKEEIGDPDLIIEDLIEPEISLGLPLSAKVSYLEKLRNKVITILYLIEQQQRNPETNPDNYLLSLLIDINAANLSYAKNLIYIFHLEMEHRRTQETQVYQFLIYSRLPLLFGNFYFYFC